MDCFHLSCEWGRRKRRKNETKTTNLEAPAALHITGKSGVCKCVCVFWVCVSLQGCRSWILRGGVLFKLPGPLDPSLSEKPLMDKRKKKKKLGGKRKGEERYKAVLMKVTKRVFLPSVIILYSFIFARLLCCGARGKERAPKKGEKRKKEKKKAL